MHCWLYKWVLGFFVIREPFERIIQLYRPSNTGSQLAVLGLLANLGFLLEKVGTTPPERLGTAASYGRKLQYIVKAKLTQTMQSYDQQTSQAQQLPEPFDISSINLTADPFEAIPQLDANWRNPFHPSMPFMPEPNQYFQQLLRDNDFANGRNT